MAWRVAVRWFRAPGARSAISCPAQSSSLGPHRRIDFWRNRDRVSDEDKGDARTWKYEDIQQLSLLSPKELTIITYEDSKWKLGKTCSIDSKSPQVK